MSRVEFDGFSAVVPEGWIFILDEGTFSEGAAAEQPTRFARPRSRGELLVTKARLHPDDQPGTDADELEALAREWGMRRGVDEPLAVTQEVREGQARASATYRIGGELIEVWFISDGTALLKATYVCPWADRDKDRAAREALIGSLRIG
jgi:hypothetical protein